MHPSFDLHTQRIPLRGGDEFDAFTPWRRVLYWHRGEKRRIERAYHHRWRRLVHTVLRQLNDSYGPVSSGTGDTETGQMSMEMWAVLRCKGLNP